VKDLFSKILIANRGEIAVKIINVCKSMNISTVAVYSKADRNSLHAKMADESYCIGDFAPKNSYLNMNAIISVALATGTEAIHPGYGFLSEDYKFARLCEENNICFIGPPSEVLQRMSDKAAAKEVARKCGINVINGKAVVYDAFEVEKFAKKLGYPIVTKPLNGGGGRGIQVFNDDQEVQKLINTGEKAFYNEKTLVEKYIFPASHVEVQMVADKYGNVLCLGERDCSIQEKKQKLIEESPCAKINDSQRKELFKKCTNLLKKIGYIGCGTMEFLLDSNGIFYFMEMNCRLQVEHAVTEMVTGLNLIKMQILIAFGETLKLKQEDIKINGWAIESRINFCGTREKNIVTKFEFHENEDVKFETFLYEGYQVPIFYDALIGKIIVHGKTRKQAIEKLNKALNDIKIDGVANNINLHKSMINNEVFKSFKHDTNFFSLYYKKKYLSANERLEMLVDKDSFVERDSDMTSYDILNFPNYKEKLKKAKETTNLNEAVIYGEAKINNINVVIFVMDGNFIMGTMGKVVGEKIKRAFDLAIKKKVPIVGVTVSGGARMQEGIFSLLQMPKTAAAVKRHNDKGLLYIAIITNPTLGGVSASFASVADIIIAEEKAVFGFSGRRIIEDTTKECLPRNFQTAEYIMNHGMIDIVAPRVKIKEYLCKILHLHEGNFYEKNN